jgi:hypothetical protein
VGVLLLLFSVLFPVAKLVSTELFLFGGPQVQKNKLAAFFALKSGKWSMADVNVVAIFMAFIGFRGIIDSRLDNLAMNTPTVESIATDATALQPGFYLFTAFVLSSLALSELLKRHLSMESVDARRTLEPSAGRLSPVGGGLRAGLALTAPSQSR